MCSWLSLSSRCRTRSTRCRTRGKSGPAGSSARARSSFELDLPADRLAEALPTLVHPDSAQRLAEVVESTQLEAVYEDVTTFGTV